MTRGTTPTFLIKVNSDLDLSTVSKLWITFEQNNIEKTFNLEDVEVNASEKTISVFMSQEDTLEFATGYALLQIRGLTADEKAFASKVKRVDIERILKEGVIE